MDGCRAAYKTNAPEADWPQACSWHYCPRIDVFASMEMICNPLQGPQTGGGSYFFTIVFTERVCPAMASRI